MTTRQLFLKFLYPLFNKLNLLKGSNSKILNNNNKVAPSSFYQLSATLNNGETLPFENFRGKKVLIVNTASDCGFTNQYEGLQALHEKVGDKVSLIAFPSNEFGAQEKGEDDTIAEFCKVNYGVSFPIAKKTIVRKGEGQNEVYKWLTDEIKNGWNYVEPTWNFCKYMINEKGELTHFFEAAIEPLSREIRSALEE